MLGQESLVILIDSCGIVKVHFLFVCKGKKNYLLSFIGNVKLSFSMSIY